MRLLYVFLRRLSFRVYLTIKVQDKNSDDADNAAIKIYSDNAAIDPDVLAAKKNTENVVRETQKEEKNTENVPVDARFTADGSELRNAETSVEIDGEVEA